MFGSGMMVRWRNFVILALLLLSPARTGSEEDDEENESESEGNDEEEGDDDPEPAVKESPRRRVVGGVGGVNLGHHANSANEGGEGGGNFAGRRPPSILAATQPTNPVTRTMRRPLECYICSYKSDSFLRSCLDPTKFRVHTMACHNVEDKCFTAVTSRGSSYEAVMRGCRSGCVTTPETTCCSADRCNNQAMAMPIIAPRAMMHANKANKAIPPSVLFFVTVLLVLQTVVKVAVV